MNDLPAPPPGPVLPPPPPAAASAQSQDVLALGKAVRFVFGCILLGLAIYNFNAAGSIRTYGQIFRDMLGEGPGSELPKLTVFVLQFQQALLALSVGVPLVCFAQMFSQNVVRSLYIFGIATLVLFTETVVLQIALNSPLAEIVKRLNNSPG